MSDCNYATQKIGDSFGRYGEEIIDRLRVDYDPYEYVDQENQDINCSCDDLENFDWGLES
tara:strand:- start:530 stop:709 length:180 start_codon:yes stop_codon:yes gene_type:complete